MTKLMQKAIDKLRNLPENKQDEFAKLILAEIKEPVMLSKAEQAAIEEGHADIEAKRFGSDKEFESTLNRLRAA